MLEPISTMKTPVEFENVEEAHKPIVGGLVAHEEIALMPEDQAAERRFILKVDCIVLPLLSLMYFLASLVCACIVSFLKIHSSNQMFRIVAILAMQLLLG